MNDRVVTDAFLGLPPHPTKIQVTYIWIDGTGEKLRSKTRTFDQPIPTKPEEFPIWNFDGSVTCYGKFSSDSDMYLKPCAVFLDPFLGGQNLLLMCETLDRNFRPTATNHRAGCKAKMDQVEYHHPWFGMEQEFQLIDRAGFPIGFVRPKSVQGCYKVQANSYYCRVGANRIFGRKIVDAHYRACLHANVKMFGTSADAGPGQWEFQIGCCEGIDMGDHLWVARYILQRVAEEFGVMATFEPEYKVTGSKGKGAGCHLNFSTEDMRAAGGLEVIKNAVPKLLEKYGNHKYATGRHSGSSSSHVIGNRAAAIRIPAQVEFEGKGYLQDRTVPSNCDPYQVTRKIVEIVL